MSRHHSTGLANGYPRSNNTFDISPPIGDDGLPIKIKHVQTDGFLSYVFLVLPRAFSCADGVPFTAIPKIAGALLGLARRKLLPLSEHTRLQRTEENTGCDVTMCSIPIHAIPDDPHHLSLGL